MKLLFVLLLSFSLSAKTDTKVFVCKSNTSVAYHVKKECRGIKSCTHEVIEITIKEAVNEYGKRACKVCY
jgi:hypothetical protein